MLRPCRRRGKSSALISVHNRVHGMAFLSRSAFRCDYERRARNCGPAASLTRRIQYVIRIAYYRDDFLAIRSFRDRATEAFFATAAPRRDGSR